MKPSVFDHAIPLPFMSRLGPESQVDEVKVSRTKGKQIDAKVSEPAHSGEREVPD
jgi:hypothetical protein